MATKEKVIKVPKTLGRCADRLMELKNETKVLSGKVETIKKEMVAIGQHLIDTLPKSEAQGVSGKIARATIQTKQVPTAKDWDKFYAHVIKTKRFSLLQRRLNDGAIKEIWDDGKVVPGVEPFTVVRVSLTKAG